MDELCETPPEKADRFLVYQFSNFTATHEQKGNKILIFKLLTVLVFFLRNHMRMSTFF